MKPVQAAIESKLRDALAPSHLAVANESHMHSVPPDSETHFKVTVVSDNFSGKRKVARHQIVYGLLKEELAGPVHALALHTYDPQEWVARSETAPASPECLGGSKADPGS